MKIGRKQLLKKYGIDLLPGTYRIIKNDKGYLINTVIDHTEGCVLIGFTKSTDFIGNSRLAYRKLFPIIRESLKTGKCFITIGVG